MGIKPRKKLDLLLEPKRRLLHRWRYSSSKQLLMVSGDTRLGVVFRSPVGEWVAADNKDFISWWPAKGDAMQALRKHVLKHHPELY